MRRGFAGGLVVCVVAFICIAIVQAEQPSPSARANTYVVQLTGPVLESWKVSLADAGAELQDYVPPFAFRARLSPDAAARVRRLPFVSAVDLIRAEHKLAPGLRRNGALPYVVRLERGAVAREVEAALRDAGAQVMRRGSQLMIVADSAMLDSLAAIDGLASIENFRPRIKHNEFGGGAIMGSNVANASGYDGSTQTIAIADTGLGIGTAAGAHQDIASSRVTGIFNWPGLPDFCFEMIANDGAQDVDSGHGTHVATAALGGGTAGGVGRGTAPAANLVFQAIENYAVPSLLCSLVYGIPAGYYLVGIPDDVGELFDQAYQQNARVHSNSWGSEVAGAYAADSANADAFIWAHRDLAVTFSAGNSGVDFDEDGAVDETSINSPGTAKNVITVGASENDRQSHWECDPSLTYTTCASQGGQNSIFTYGSAWPERFTVNPLRDDPSAGNAEQMAAFSSRGPTSDGRIKPDVVAPGTWNLSGYAAAFQQEYDPSANPVTGAYQYDGWGFPASASYKYMGGTSMSAPLVAGGAAVVRDFYQKSRGHHASAALVKAVLINSAVDLLDENNDGVLDNAQPIPNRHEGWGRVDLANATDASDSYFDEAAPLTTGTSTSHAFDVTSAGVPLKVSLVWTDFPASTSATTSLVNDLDLTVIAPDGTSFKGNVFAGGWSTTGGVADRLNNVENVYVFAAAAGTWTITVSGYNVPQGPQPFALVIDTTPPGGSGLPLVRVTVDDSTATEAGPTAGVIRFTRTGDTGSALEVAYAVSGTATSGADFVPLTGLITIPEGSVDATVVVTALDDAIYEVSESVVATVTATPAYGLGSPASALVTIASDDLPPDFSVSGATAPANAAAGSTINVVITTKNSGTGVAPASRTGLYLSTNSSWSTTDLYLTDVAVSPLGLGATELTSVPIEVPADTAPGSYFVIAKADWAGVIDESNETNNTRATNAFKVGPDLLVSTLTAPATAAAGETILVTDTTKNQGAGTAGESTTSFYLSSNLSLDVGDVLLGSRAVNVLTASATHVASTTLSIPVATAVGNYYVLALADSASIVVEYTETNNVRGSGQVRVGADLSVTVLTVPAAAGAGQVIDVTETTASIGAADAPESITRYYFSSNNVLDPSDQLIGSRTVPLLEAGTTSAVTVQLTIPASAATGSHYVIANADDAHEIAETSETNNSKKVIVKIGPDLTMGDVDAFGPAGPGDTLTVTDTTQNSGGGATGAATDTAFYLSINGTLDASDIFLGVRTVPALGAGQASNGSTPFTVPAGTASGMYYVIAKADYTSALVEILETNNARTSGSVRIGPDLVVSALTAPSTVVRGTPFTITDTTRNDGSTAAATTTSYYFSVNNTIDASDLLLATHPVGVLGPTGTESGQATVTIPATQATGIFYIIAKTDHGGVVSESSETNNTKLKSIKVNP